MKALMALIPLQPPREAEAKALFIEAAQKAATGVGARDAHCSFRSEQKCLN